MGKLFKGCLTSIGAIVVLIIVIALFTGGDDNDEDQAEDGAEVEEENQEVSGSESEGIEETATDEDGDEAALFSMGETVDVGDMQYTIEGMDTTSSIGDEIVGSETSDVFVILDVSVTNNGNDSVTVDSSYLELLLDESTYSADTTASRHASEGDTDMFLEQINPGSSLEGSVAFDVTEDVAENENLMVQVQEGMFGTNTAIINLD